MEAFEYSDSCEVFAVAPSISKRGACHGDWFLDRVLDMVDWEHFIEVFPWTALTCVRNLFD